MTTYAFGCAASLTVTPSLVVGLTFVFGCAVSLSVTPTIVAAIYQTYTDENGAQQPVYLTEWYKGRNVEQAGFTLKLKRVFFIHGAFDPTECTDLGPQVGDLDDVLPTFVVQNRSLEMYAKGGGESNIVRLEVDYQQPTRPQSEGEDAEATFTFDFTSESEHVDVAFIQANYGKQPQLGENLLINYDGQTVDGVDIESPIMEMSEEHVLTEAEFSVAFRKGLRDNVAKVNSQTFRGFSAGEVLFSGASASKRGKRWYVTFRFRVRRNLTNIPYTIINEGGAEEAITVFSKLGWEYLWISMEKRGADGDTKLQVAPSAVHVAQVYTYIDFAVLGIGVEPLR